GRAEGRPRPTDASGAGDEGVGNSDDPGLLAAGAGAQRAQLRDLARAAAAGVASGRDSDSGGGQPFPARALHDGVQPALCSAGRGGRDGVCAGAPTGLGSGFLPPARARGESRQHRAARSEGVADREDALAWNAGGVPRDPVRALGWTTDHSLRSAPGGSFFSRGVAGAEAKRAIQDQTGSNLRGGARRFSALTSVALRAPSVSAEGKAKPDRSCAIKTGHFNVLPTLVILSLSVTIDALLDKVWSFLV